MGLEETLIDLKKEGEAPEWMTHEGFATLNGGYLLPGETPRSAYQRVAKAAGLYAGAEYTTPFFEAMWNNWLCLATPVFSNLGTTRGMPISCNGLQIPDSVDGIFQKNHELAMLSKNGAGVSVYMGDLRPRGSVIAGNGKSEGIIPWSKVFDTTTVAVSQGSSRRGATALYLPIEHGDISEFLNLRRSTGDINRRCMNINHGVTITDAWMKAMLEGDYDKRSLWADILRTRFETGEPYIIFIDAMNRANPEAYTKNGLSVKCSNLCSEISLHTDEDHSFICCLSSLNLVTWDGWRDTNLVELSTRFLDAVLSEYIDKADGIPGLEPSRQSALKGRAVGLGVLGWHTALQKKNLTFGSMESMLLNAEIFGHMHKQSKEASRKLAVEFGEPEWCKGTGYRNTHTMALAPTVSNSAISGGYSPGIEPLAANIYSQKSAKGTFICKNKVLEEILELRGCNDPQTWRSIIENQGSVSNLECLSDHEKQVFLTAREINQFDLVKLAGQRQQWVDQAQSLNLFFGQNSDPKYINEVHIEAWKAGLKSLYYLRSEGVLRGDLASRSSDECEACSG